MPHYFLTVALSRPSWKDITLPFTTLWWHTLIQGQILALAWMLAITWDKKLGLSHKVFTQIPPTIFAIVGLLFLMPDMPASLRLPPLSVGRLAATGILTGVLLFLQSAQMTGLLDRRPTATQETHRG